jgi:predicted nucleic acid-binding protein
VTGGSRLVVDASVALKWVLDEVHSDAAARLLALPGARFAVPAVFWAETGNALWKAAARGVLSDAEAQATFDDLRRAPVEVFDTPLLHARALELALALKHPVYDCLYLTLAIAEGTRVVTADGRLLDIARRNGLDERVLWIEDVPLP